MSTLQLSGFHYVIHNEEHSEIAPLLLLHKTGGDENELLPLAHQINPQWPIIGVRGNIVEDGKFRFFKRSAPRVFDEANLRENAFALADFIVRATSKHRLPSPIALGLSNGANIATALMYLRPEALSAAVLLRPAVPFKPAPPATLTGIDVLSIAGKTDQVVSAAETKSLLDDLALKGANVTREVVDAGHRIAINEADIIRTWLERRRLSLG